MLLGEAACPSGQEAASQARSPLAAGIAIVSLAAALTACGSAPFPGTPECGLLCEASYWASASEAEVRAQLEKDPDLSAKAGEFGLTPLHMAASHTRNPAVIGLLLDAGAGIGSTGDANGATPLHTAAAFNPEPAMGALILDHPVDVELRGQNGRTALHTAALHNPNPEVHRILVEHGSRISARDNDGMTPLHSAAESNPAPRA